MVGVMSRAGGTQRRENVYGAIHGNNLIGWNLMTPPAQGA